MCTVVAAVIGAVGSVVQGIAAQSAANAQAAAAMQAGETNARIAEMQATDAVKRGGEQEQKLRRHIAALIGRQRSTAAASGIYVDSGSALDARNASLLEGERDVLTNALNHGREAWGFGVQATNYRNQAKAEAAAAKAQGRSAFLGGLFGGASSLLSLAAPSFAGSKSITVGAGQVNSPYQGFGGAALPSGLTVGQQYYKYKTGNDSLVGKAAYQPGWW